MLYTYRVLLTGIHLMRTGKIEANLSTLNESSHLSHINDLILRKQNGAEKERLSVDELSFHQTQYERLIGCLEEAYAQCDLPETPSARPALSNLLIRLRLTQKESSD